MNCEGLSALWSIRLSPENYGDTSEPSCEAVLTALLPSRPLVSESLELQWSDCLGTGQQSLRVTGVLWACSQDGARMESLKDSDTWREDILGRPLKQMYRPNSCSCLMRFAEKFLGWNWEVNVKSFIYNSLALWLTFLSEPPLLSCRWEIPLTSYN